jgi:branched-chain amino acid transport system permease protein
LAASRHFPLVVQAILVLAVVTPMGPLLYRVVYQPMAEKSVLVLMIVSVGVHFVMLGLGLLFFGPEGSHTPPFWDARLELGSLTVSGQSVVVVVTTLVLIAGLWLFFDRTFYGKALRATAVNRLGARLIAISTSFAGKLSFALAAFIGALCGLLIAPITTIYYDSGFLIGLKSFVAAVIGGLSSYPLTALGALFIGLLESFSSFWASAYKESIVFLLVIPVLLWLSLSSGGQVEEE